MSLFVQKGPLISLWKLLCVKYVYGSPFLVPGLKYLLLDPACLPEAWRTVFVAVIFNPRIGILGKLPGFGYLPDYFRQRLSRRILLADYFIDGIDDRKPFLALYFYLFQDFFPDARKYLIHFCK